jgi:hypothetical protein
MSARQLQDELARRGLSSSRAAKGVMVQRLLDNDADGDALGGDEPTTPPDAAEEGSASNGGDHTEPRGAVPVNAFRKDFPAEPGGPDEETHLAYRQATEQAAFDAGFTLRGGARLAVTTDGRWVYEVSVRRPS